MLLSFFVEIVCGTINVLNALLIAGTSEGARWRDTADYRCNNNSRFSDGETDKTFSCLDTCLWSQNDLSCRGQ